MTEQMLVLDIVARVWIGLMWVFIAYTSYKLAKGVWSR